MARHSKTRTIWVHELDRPLAAAEAVQRAMSTGAMWACVVAMERKIEPLSERGAWEVILKVSRRRR